jgi:hypothetical protein
MSAVSQGRPRGPHRNAPRRQPDPEVMLAVIEDDPYLEALVAARCGTSPLEARLADMITAATLQASSPQAAP